MFEAIRAVPPAVMAAGAVALSTITASAITPPVSSPDVPALRFTASARLRPGVVYRTFRTSGRRGPAFGGLLEVDLRNRRVSVGLLHPPAVAARAPVSAMVDAAHGVAGINGDFFDISERRHAGIPPTGAAVGPEVADGHVLKGAVPDGQRFGPLPPFGSSTEDVIGVDTGGAGRVSSLRLTGTVRVGRPANATPAPGPTGATGSAGTAGSPGTVLPLRGLNQYALPVGGIGAFTADWGSASRRRAACGSDLARGAPCTTDVREVTVRDGVVTRTSGTLGAGPIPPGTTVLAGREAGADALRDLRPGDPVDVAYRLTGPRAFRFAIGGMSILRSGTVPSGLDPTVSAPRTAAGVDRSGRRMYLLVVDGHTTDSRGLTLSELAALLRRVGADDAIDLDGGGSSTFAVRTPGKPGATVRNTPSDHRERPVANGIGIFAHG